MTDMRCGSCSTGLKFYRGVSYCPSCHEKAWVRKKLDGITSQVHGKKIPKSALEKIEQTRNSGYKVYALALDDGCYYIGKSSKPKKRITNHFSGSGAEWTKRHTPITLESIEVVETNKEAKQREVNLFLEYVDQYGEDNVRGAGYTRVDNPSWNDS